MPDKETCWQPMSHDILNTRAKEGIWWIDFTFGEVDLQGEERMKADEYTP